MFMSIRNIKKKSQNKEHVLFIAPNNIELIMASLYLKQWDYPAPPKLGPLSV